MRQFVGSVARRLDGARPARLGRAAGRAGGRQGRSSRPSCAMMERDDERTQMRYAQALSTGPTPAATRPRCCGTPARWRRSACRSRRRSGATLRTLSGGEQKRLVLEALLRGPDEVLLLDEPDNYLDVPGKRWLEEQLRESPKTVLFVSHDRELLARSADADRHRRARRRREHRPGSHGGGFATYHAGPHRAVRPARGAAPPLGRGARQAQGAGRDATSRRPPYNDGMASRYQAAQTRLRKFEEAGPPRGDPPREQDVTMRLRGGRTGKRAVICEGLELTGLMKPFDLEVWYGERVAVLGSNGSGKSHFLRLLAAAAPTPTSSTGRSTTSDRAGRAHRRARLGARVRPGWFAQTHEHPELVGRTLLDILLARRRAPRRAGPRGGVPGAGPLRAGARRRADVRLAVRRPAGPAADPAAGALRCHPAAAGRAHRQPRPRSPPRRWRRAWRRSTAPWSP